MLCLAPGSVRALSSLSFPPLQRYFLLGWGHDEPLLVFRTYPLLLLTYFFLNCILWSLCPLIIFLLPLSCFDSFLSDFTHLHFVILIIIFVVHINLCVCWSLLLYLIWNLSQTFSSWMWSLTWLGSLSDVVRFPNFCFNGKAVP